MSTGSSKCMTGHAHCDGGSPSAHGSGGAQVSGRVATGGRVRNRGGSGPYSDRGAHCAELPPSFLTWAQLCSYLVGVHPLVGTPRPSGRGVSGGRRHYRGINMHIQGSQWPTAVATTQVSDGTGGGTGSSNGANGSGASTNGVSSARRLRGRRRPQHTAAGGRPAQSGTRTARRARGLRRAGVRRSHGGRGPAGARRCRHGLPPVPEQGRPRTPDSRGGDLPADGAGAHGAGPGGRPVVGAVALPSDVGRLGRRAAAAAGHPAGEREHGAAGWTA